MVATCDRPSNFMATCVNPNCDIIIHTHFSSENTHKMFKIPEFAGLSCFEIAHDELCTGLFLLTIKKLLQSMIKRQLRIVTNENNKHHIVYAT